MSENPRALSASRVVMYEDNQPVPISILSVPG